MDILYQVIIENQKVRTDLLKWKLIIAAAVATLGLGASEIKLNTLPTVDLALCCIPFAAAYVDLLCSHLSLRVQVIGRFIRTTQFQTGHENSLQAYEEFVGRARQGDSASRGTVNPFGLEAKALYASSINVVPRR